MPALTTETSTEVTTPATKSVATPATPKAPKPKAAPKKAAKAKPAPKKVAMKKEKPTKNTSGTHDGTKVGWKHKCAVDTHWNAARVVFYTALRKIGGSGTAQAIAKASNGKIAVGNCLHFGYHGVTPGYNKIERMEDVRGFTFTLTAKGRSMDLDKMLTKDKAERAKAKAAAKAE